MKPKIGDIYYLALDNEDDNKFNPTFHCEITKVTDKYVHYRWLDWDGGPNKDGKDKASLDYFLRDFKIFVDFNKELENL